MPPVSIEAARIAKDQARSIVPDSAGVTSVGITRVGGAYAVKINLVHNEPAGLPTQINGVPVVYEQTGRARVG